MRGLFVSFEGVEGSGKSTQIDLAVQALKGRGCDVYVTREPGGTPLAERIRELILNETADPPVDRAEMFLLQAARAQHVDRVIIPKLEDGALVVCDRFFDSTIAYQGYARGLDLPMVHSCVRVATGGLEPDVTIVLDMPPAQGLERQFADMFAHHDRNRMESEALDFHESVRRGFLEQAAANPNRIKVLDASKSVAQVHKKVMAALAPAVDVWLAARQCV